MGLCRSNGIWHGLKGVKEAATCRWVGTEVQGRGNRTHEGLEHGWRVGSSEGPVGLTQWEQGAGEGSRRGCGVALSEEGATGSRTEERRHPKLTFTGFPRLPGGAWWQSACDFM